MANVIGCLVGCYLNGLLTMTRTSPTFALENVEQINLFIRTYEP